MMRRSSVVAMIVLGAALLAPQAQGTGRCTLSEIRAGTCEADGGHGVGVGDSETVSDDGTPGAPESGSAIQDDPGFAEPGKPLDIYETCRDDVHENQSCLGGIRVDVPTAEAPAPTVPGSPGWSVTITDLARFVPSTATVDGEPGNVAVVGLPANFLSSAKTETVQGTVLGRALSIRFTPVNYAFDYGDGESRDSAGPGTAWDANGQAQFTPTNTSHVYKQAGRYTVTVAVTYAADVDLGGGWIPIRGTLNGPLAGQEIRVVKAHTALVLGTCAERPSAPGC